MPRIGAPPTDNTTRALLGSQQLVQDRQAENERNRLAAIRAFSGIGLGAADLATGLFEGIANRRAAEQEGARGRSFQERENRLDRENRLEAERIASEGRTPRLSPRERVAETAKAQSTTQQVSDLAKLRGGDLVGAFDLLESGGEDAVQRELNLRRLQSALGQSGAFVQPSRALGPSAAPFEVTNQTVGQLSDNPVAALRALQLSQIAGLPADTTQSIFANIPAPAPPVDGVPQGLAAFVDDLGLQQAQANLDPNSPLFQGETGFDEIIAGPFGAVVDPSPSTVFNEARFQAALDADAAATEAFSSGRIALFNVLDAARQGLPVDPAELEAAIEFGAQQRLSEIQDLENDEFIDSLRRVDQNLALTR